MAVFPDLSLNPTEGMGASVSSGVQWQASVSGKDWGVDLWGGRKKRAWNPTWDYLPLDDEQILREFYEDNADTTFYLFDWDSRRKYSNQAADETGTGLLLTFTLPGKSLDDVSVYVDAATISESDWSLSAGAGANGEDQVVFSASTPSDGAIVTADFTGRKRYEARFEGGIDDEYSYYPKLSCTLIEVF